MQQVVNLAYCEKKDWERFIALIDDSASMHETWQAWHKDYQKTKKKLISQAYTVKEITININQLRVYCLQRGMKIDGKARAEFVSQIR